MSGLKRELRLVDAAALVTGTIIGGGIFIAPNLVARQIDSSAWILAAWVIGGVLSLFGALAFAELGAMLPQTGGQYVYLRAAYGPLAGFLSGWTGLLVVYAGALAWLAVSAATLTGQFVKLGPAGAKTLAVGVIALATWANCRGVRTGAAVQNTLTLLKLLGLALILTTAALSPATAPSISHQPVRAGALGLALIACLLSYDGWANLGLVAGEMKQPQRDLPRALALGVGTVTAIYVLANVAYLRVMTPSEMAGAERVGALAAERLMGATGGMFLAGVILLSVLGAMNGWMLAAPRIYYAMARDRLFFRSFGEVHQQHGTPTTAIVFQGVWASVLTLSGTYETLAAYAMFAFWIFYGAAALGVIVLRKKLPGLERPYRMWGYPVTPVMFAAAALGFVLNTLIEAPGPALAALGLIAAGVPAYFLWGRMNREDGRATEMA